jgi:hypothetical protein
MYGKLETLYTVSSKLDMIPVINDRLLSLENRVQGIQAEIVGIKNELHVHFHSERISSSDQLSLSLMTGSMSNLDETVSNVSNFAYISWRIFMGGGWEKFDEDH